MVCESGFASAVSNVDLIDLRITLNGAIEDASKWTCVCDEIAKVFGGNGALLIPFEPEQRGTWLPVSPALTDALAEYIEEGWHLNDYRQNLANIVKNRGYATDDDLEVSRNERAEMPFYRYLFKHNIGFMINFLITTPQGYWAVPVYFDNDRHPITKDEIKIIEQIRPLIEEATAKADLAAHKKIADFAKFFEGTNTEIYVLNPMGEHCMYLGTNGRLSITKSLPTQLSKPISEDIRKGLEEVCSSAPELSMSRSFQINGNSKTFNLLAIQVPFALRHYYMPFKVCLIITEVESRQVLQAQRLKSEYDFLPSEITTLQLLSTGRNVKSISEFLSLKESTIRQRLKQMYEKAAVSGQVELIGFYNGL